MIPRKTCTRKYVSRCLHRSVLLAIAVYNLKRFDISYSSKNTAIPAQKDYIKHLLRNKEAESKCKGKSWKTLVFLVIEFYLYLNNILLIYFTYFIYIILLCYIYYIILHTYTYTNVFIYI